uniref:Endothelin-converting protein 10 n=1 Tax=Tityus serrulatus TaxID=6887 RepID=A0A1S5QN08_TITSE|nr:endothelin-converting protein 10 [Tityus serrulatus]
MPRTKQMINKNFLRTFWNERTKTEKRLLIINITLSILILCLIIPILVIYANKGKPSMSSEIPICTTSSCTERSKQLKRWINYSVNPCDDFYSYCCDGWIRDHPLPENSAIFGPSEELEMKINSKINDLLSNLELDKYSPIPVNKTVTFYRACLDTENIELRGAEPFLDLIKELGGWPIISSEWNGGTFNWIDAITWLLRKTASGYIVRFIISPDIRNTSYNIIQLDKPSLSQRTSILLNSSSEENRIILKNYKEHIKNMVKLLNITNTETLEKDVEEIIDFERKLAAIFSPDDENTLNYNKFTIKEFTSIIPEFPWMDYLQLVTNTTLEETGDFITEYEQIIVRDVEYFKKLPILIKKFSKRQIANYLGWRLMEKHYNHLPQAFIKEILRYQNVSENFSLERWKICVSLTKVAFGYAVAHSYISDFFSDISKCDIKEMVDEIRFAFKNVIENTEWMDNSTKYEAIKKIEFMSDNVGYPDWIMDKRRLSEFYQNLGEIGNDPFKNDLVISEYTSSQLFRSLRKKPKMTDWSIMPLTVNAAYDQNQNSITVPLGILHVPFYNRKLPKYLNYAAIGAIIGHEMTHGFDTKGRERNAEGININWWSEKSKYEFTKRTQCFIEQYDSYGISGIKTLAENIADNGGIKLAYSAYRKLKDAQERKDVLPDFRTYTVDQLFFLSYGSMWCTQYNQLGWNFTTSKSVHSPPIHRVMGSLSNMKEFSEAFKCSENDKMNSRKRCVIW